jgi:polycystin 1L2
VERVLPVAGDEQQREFSYVLSKQAYHSMSEGHLWFSIFSRPPSNVFTRVQRCTCCFVLLFTAMLLNILYYDRIAEAKATEGLSWGPLHISPQQVRFTDGLSLFEYCVLV